jgi:hypothetical protein
LLVSKFWIRQVFSVDAVFVLLDSTTTNNFVPHAIKNIMGKINPITAPHHHHHQATFLLPLVD